MRGESTVKFDCPHQTGKSLAGVCKAEMTTWTVLVGNAGITVGL